MSAALLVAATAQLMLVLDRTIVTIALHVRLIAVSGALENARTPNNRARLETKIEVHDAIQ